MARQWLGKLASLKLTLAIMALVGVGAAVSYYSEGAITWALALPLFLLSLSIFAAVLTNPVFRRQAPLLMFHLALIAIILLMAVGQLTYMKGTVEVTEGAAFSSDSVKIDKGLLHWGQIDKVSFINEGFTIEYAPGVRRGKTRNSLRWRDESGREQRGVIGDMVPLRLYGYSFYTSPNKGFAPAFTWYPGAGGPTVAGAVHLPSYPVHEHQQALTWTPPGSRDTVWVMLQLDEVVLDPQKPSSFRLPVQHRLVVRSGEERRELRPGDFMRLSDGVLEYNGLHRWMGYTISYNFTLPWLLAAGILAVGSLAAYFWGKFSARPWDE